MNDYKEFMLLDYKVKRDGTITIKEALRLLERATCKLNTLTITKEM